MLVLPLSTSALRHVTKVVEMIVIGEIVGPVVVMEVVTSGSGVEEDVIVVVNVIVVQFFKVAGDVIHRAMQVAAFSPAAQGSKILEHIAKNAKLENLPMVLVRPPVSIVRQAHLPMVQERPPASTVRPGHIWRQLETIICPIASHVLRASTH
jgi:hypothetical protein